MDGALRSVTGFWFCYGLYVAPSPERTRVSLLRTCEQGSTVVGFQQVFDDAHFREFIVFFAAGLCLFCRFPSADGFFICVAFVF